WRRCAMNKIETTDFADCAERESVKSAQSVVPAFQPERKALAISARGLVKRYQGGRIIALGGLDLDVAAGEFVAICGPSGCGKSTLLNLVAAIDRPDSGDLSVLGHRLADLSSKQADEFRSTTIGMVFQLHNLLPHLSAAENL